MLVDCWAWVEFFEGSEKGAKIMELMRNETNLYVSSLTLAEVANWCVKNSKTPVDVYLSAIKTNAAVFDVGERTAEIAGKNLSTMRKRSPGIGMVDAILYSQAALMRLPLLTGDPHFKHLENVVFVD